MSKYLWSLKKGRPCRKYVVIPELFTQLGCKYPQIEADSVAVSVQVHCGGVQSQNGENGVSVLIYVDLTPYAPFTDADQTPGVYANVDYQIDEDDYENSDFLEQVVQEQEDSE